MRASRSGFTLVELLIVVSLMGIMGMFAYPRLRGSTTSWSVRSARQQTTEMLVVARSAAVQNGADARFIRSGNVVRVVIDSSGTWVTLASKNLDTEYGVAYGVSSGGRDTVRYDARGIAIGLSGAQWLRFSKDTKVDSVCVSRMGKVAPRSCS